LSKKLGRNDPCWCGSGRKYKHCHLNRGSETPLRIEAIIDKMDDSSRYQTCLHPEAAPNVCGRISSAHTLQRSRVLRAIESSDHHILTFYPMRFENNKLKVHRKGWRKAATFDAFCNKHDSKTFAPLESKPFSGSKEQIFLIGYRAVCWELYQKTRAIRAQPTISKYIDRGTPLDLQKFIQKSIAVQDAGFRKGYEEVKKVKSAMDKAYLRKDYSAYDTFRIKITGPIDIAATGGITPNRTLSGVHLQTLHDTSAEIEWLSFGVDVEPGGASIVFLWQAKTEAPRKYIEELQGLCDEELECFIPQFFFAHCENTYFSESWWRNCSKISQSFVKDLMVNSNPYYYPPKYDLSHRLTSWSVVGREDSHSGAAQPINSADAKSRAAD